jgi:proteic killer suppression protein
MLIKFKNEYLEKLFKGEPIKGKPKFSDIIVIKFKKAVLILKNFENSVELSKFRGLNFEALKGNKNGLYSIRVNDAYRLGFSLEKDSIELTEIVNI